MPPGTYRLTEQHTGPMVVVYCPLVVSAWEQTAPPGSHQRISMVVVPGDMTRVGAKGSPEARWAVRGGAVGRGTDRALESKMKALPACNQQCFHNRAH